MSFSIAFVLCSLIAAPPLRVPENRAAPGGRMIELAIDVIPAVPGKKSADAIFVLAGGPGQAAAKLKEYASRIFAGSERDLVFVDARGTGGSNPLHCDFGGSDSDLAGYFNDMLPVDRVAKCREIFAPRADLTQYTTRAIVEDVEAARKHLGYAMIDLYGSSYGTRVAQEVMRHYPNILRLVILDGVVPPSLASPLTFARDAQRSLDAVLAMCKADEKCRTAYPNLKADYDKMVQAAARGLELEVEHPTTKKPVKVKINRGFFGEIMRNFLYSAEIYVDFPKAIHSAARGDWKIFSEMAIRYAMGIRTLDFGLFLSVTCTEDIPRLDVAKAKADAKDTMLGPYRIEQQLAACEKWVRGTADPLRTQPVKAAIPTLIISGELDPVTPPRFGEEVAKTLSNVVHLVIPSGAHSGDTGGCQEKIVVEAVRKGSVKDLDMSCVKKIARPPFAL